MNIFVLDLDPKLCASYHCDAHVRKMNVEYAQILSTAIRVRCAELAKHPPNVYKTTHKNNKCCIWARENQSNFSWLLALGTNLSDEFLYRFGKEHGSSFIYREAANHISIFTEGSLTNFVLRMPDYCQMDSAVESYRRYYINEKRHLAKWAKRKTPNWHKKGLKNAR